MAAEVGYWIAPEFRRGHAGRGNRSCTPVLLLSRVAGREEVASAVQARSAIRCTSSRPVPSFERFPWLSARVRCMWRQARGRFGAKRMTDPLRNMSQESGLAMPRRRRDPRRN